MSLKQFGTIPLVINKRAYVQQTFWIELNMCYVFRMETGNYSSK